MNKILKRPMFRKGGEVMEGIMTGIKPREQFAEKGLADELRQRMDLIQQVAGPTGGFSDPITQLLLSTGLGLASEKRPGGLIANIAGSLKGPTQQLFKDLGAQRQLKTTLAANLIKDFSKQDVDKAYQEYGKFTGLSEEEFKKQYGRAKLYKDEPSPEAKLQSEKKISIVDIQNQPQNISTATGKSILPQDAAEIIFNAKVDIKQSSPDLVKDLDPTKDNISIKEQLKFESDGSLSFADEIDAGKYREGKIYFNINDGIWYRRQGKRLIPVDRG
jgi:hypothetical protein